MSNLAVDDDYESSDDEDYVPPADAPENENDIYLVDKGEDDKLKPGEPTKDIDELWADFLKPASTTNLPTSSTSTETPKSDPVIPSGKKRKIETPKSSGLDAALDLMKRSKKTSVLEKSQKDWNKFVAEKSIKEELDSHNKSQNSYLDKQDFIAKADYNMFIKEKAARDSARKPQ